MSVAERALGAEDGIMSSTTRARTFTPSEIRLFSLCHDELLEAGQLESRVADYIRPRCEC